jgi:hypothetical protein
MAASKFKNFSQKKHGAKILSFMSQTEQAQMA